MDRHNFDAGPDPTFHFDADPDPVLPRLIRVGKSEKNILLTAVPVYIVYLSSQRQKA